MTAPRFTTAAAHLDATVVIPVRRRLARRWQVFLGSAFVADVVERRYLVAGCAVLLVVAFGVALLTRGTYWTGTEWAPIPVGGTR